MLPGAGPSFFWLRITWILMRVGQAGELRFVKLFELERILSILRCGRPKTIMCEGIFAILDKVYLGRTQYFSLFKLLVPWELHLAGVGSWVNTIQASVWGWIWVSSRASATSCSSWSCTACIASGHGSALWYCVLVRLSGHWVGVAGEWTRFVLHFWHCSRFKETFSRRFAEFLQFNQILLVYSFAKWHNFYLGFVLLHVRHSERITRLRLCKSKLVGFCLSWVLSLSGVWSSSRNWARRLNSISSLFWLRSWLSDFNSCWSIPSRIWNSSSSSALGWSLQYLLFLLFHLWLLSFSLYMLIFLVIYCSLVHISRLFCSKRCKVIYVVWALFIFPKLFISI